jgi:hypothetical protein
MDCAGDNLEAFNHAAHTDLHDDVHKRRRFCNTVPADLWRLLAMYQGVRGVARVRDRCIDNRIGSTTCSSLMSVWTGIDATAHRLGLPYTTLASVSPKASTIDFRYTDIDIEGPSVSSSKAAADARRPPNAFGSVTT